jgi:hypothetical protein
LQYVDLPWPDAALAVKASVTLHSNPGITLFCFNHFLGLSALPLH